MNDLTIALIQTGLFWEAPEKNRLSFTKKLDSLPEGVDLIVLPEMFTTGFSMQPEGLAERMDGPTLLWMKEQARKHNAILTGSLIVEEDKQYYNRLIWMCPDGSFSFYDKRHLFTLAGEHHHYSAGARRPLMEWKGWKVMPQICYDLRFPAWSRNTNGYDLLLYVANWPTPRREHWKKLLIARAIENQAYVIGLNRVGEDGNGHTYSGDSSVVDFSGEVLYRASGVEDLFVVKLSKDSQEAFRQRFAFLNDQDRFEFL
jgi:omega-amidase